MATPTEAALAAADENRSAALERLFDLLRIPSVSTDPAYADDVARAAAWCADTLSDFGFDSSVVATTGHPVVVAHHPGESDGPRLLYYGHYDVQPPEPLELWESPPFEPQLVDGPRGERIVARGAVDDKGQLMTFIEALRAWKSANGSFPGPVTIMLEGEEECGSPSLPGFFAEHAAALAADVCIVCDTAMWDFETPAVTTRLRGLVYLEVTLEGPARDLHSGHFGGAVLNPNQALAEVLAALHDADGRVTVPGFYDDVDEISPVEREAWAGLDFDEEAFLGEAGLPSSLGERGLTILERTWGRPTLEINGMWGGYTGAGAKTVIPARASAKISCRLVASQDPHRVKEAIESHLRAIVPEGARLTFETFGVEPAASVPAESPHVQAALRALEDTFGRPAKVIGTGGSIPVVGMLQRDLGLPSLLVGFGLEDDRVHSPNEKFERACYERGIRAHIRLLGELAGGA